MIDYTLKFPDEATANEMLEPFIATHNIDVIGIISKPTGEMIDTPEGPSPVMAAIPGWHVNVRGVGPDDFSEYEVTVATPFRAWA
jgi:hypothetical protein